MIFYPCTSSTPGERCLIEVRAYSDRVVMELHIVTCNKHHAVFDRNAPIAALHRKTANRILNYKPRAKVNA